jgi:hypothetical protein
MDNNFKKKNKFVENLNIEYNKQPFYEMKNYVNMNEFKKNNFNNKNKSEIELSKTLDPFDYNVPYFNRIKKDSKGDVEYVYYTPYNQGPGRGFGNLNVNNFIYKKEQSRNNTDDFKLHREAVVIDRFQFLDNRYSNPNNVVFPFPRSGEMTRKINMGMEDIIDYNFSKPKVEYYESDNNFAENINDTTIDTNNLPNKNLFETGDRINEDQRQRQLLRQKKLLFIENKIVELKKKYGENLTKQIIMRELNLSEDLEKNDMILDSMVE